MPTNLPSHIRPFLSIVVPVYRSKECLFPLFERLKSTLEQHVTADFELILVDDASPDNAWPVIQELVSAEPRVKGIRLSRNFGQYMALTAGLDASQGQWVVVMDCDLQDIPEEIPKLYQKAQDGFDIVLAKRVERQDNFFKKFFSWAFYQVFSYLTDTHHDPSTAQFGIYSRPVINTFLSMRERLRFLPAFIEWVGFAKTAIPVEHGLREHGSSGYSFNRLLNLAMDTILAFSDKPLRLTIKLGCWIAFFSLAFAAVIAIRAMMGIPEPLGWASTMIAISFFSGLIILILGMNGLYISRIFDEVKQRPLYIVRQSETNPEYPYSTEASTQITSSSCH